MENRRSKSPTLQSSALCDRQISQNQQFQVFFLYFSERNNLLIANNNSTYQDKIINQRDFQDE